MGAVYRAYDSGLKREVALKLLPLIRPERVARFETEVAALVRLQHPNVVRIHSAGQHGRSAYLVMDLVEGRTLERRFEELGPLPPREACYLVAKLADAVQAVHDAGLLHRDLKPANVILREDGEPVLVDFGIAKQIDSGLEGPTRTGAMIGSPGYWSPEQASGARERIGTRSDVYGVGAIFYACLTGRPPFTAATLAELMVRTASEPPEPPSSYAPVEPELERICLACLAKDPERRYASASDLAADLRRVLAGSSPQHLPARSRRGARAALALGVGALGLAGVALAWGGGRGAEPSARLERPSPTPSTGAAAASPSAAPTPLDLGPLLPERIPTLAERMLPGRGARGAARELTPRYAALRRVERRSRLLPMRGRGADMVELALRVRYREDTRPGTAAMLYQGAAGKGVDRSWVELASSFAEGEAGASRDRALRLRMLLLALRWRSVAAADALASSWWSGLGVPRDLALSAAARRIALDFGHTKSRGMAKELERAGVSIPPSAIAWRQLREVAEQAAQTPPVPYVDRGPPPPPLRPAQLAARARPFLAWLPLRFPAFAEVLTRAEALPHQTPAAWDRALLGAREPARRAALALRLALQGQLGRLPELAQAFLSGQGAPRDPLLARLLLAFDVEHRPGQSAALRALGDAVREAQPELAAACARLAAARAPREATSDPALGGPAEGAPSDWRLFWRAQRADLVAAGLGHEAAARGGPPPLRLPERVSDLPRRATREGGARLAWLTRYAPALQWLERERQRTPRPADLDLAMKQAQVAHDLRRQEALRFHRARAGDLGAVRDLLMPLALSEGLPGDRSTARRLLLELLAVGGGGATSSLQQLQPELLVELRVISAELGHGRSRDFVANRRSRGEEVPSLAQAWGRLRAASEAWREEPLGDALTRTAPLREPAQRAARLRATVQALGARWAKLGAALAAPPSEVSPEALARARAGEERELALRIAAALALPGEPDGVLRLVQVLDDDPSLVPPALALAHALYDVSGEERHLRRLSGSYRAQELFALATLCATLAGEEGAELQLERQLPWLPAEERERAFAYERERAFACAGLPALDLPPRRFGLR